MNLSAISKKNSWLELYMPCFLWAFSLSSTLNYLYRCCKIFKSVYPLNNASTMEKDAVVIGTTYFLIHAKKITYNCEKGPKYRMWMEIRKISNCSTTVFLWTNGCLYLHSFIFAGCSYRFLQELGIWSWSSRHQGHVLVPQILAPAAR